MFADDVKMYVQIVNCVDMERLQSALSALYDWVHFKGRSVRFCQTVLISIF